MRAPLTLAAYAAALALVFGAATAVGAAVGPVGTVAPAEDHRGEPHGAGDAGH